MLKNFDHKSPDAVWEGMNWEIKHPISMNVISKRTEKGLKQICENGGGIIINIANLNSNLSKIRKTVDNRINLSWKSDAPVDVMIIKKVIAIWKYKKREDQSPAQWPRDPLFPLI